MSGPTAGDVPDPLRVDLQHVRHVEISYSRARPLKAELAVEYIGGGVRVFEVDRFLIERLLEYLERMGDEETAQDR
jgi:hypothetical protein